MSDVYFSEKDALKASTPKLPIDVSLDSMIKKDKGQVRRKATFRKNSNDSRLRRNSVSRNSTDRRSRSVGSRDSTRTELRRNRRSDSRSVNRDVRRRNETRGRRNYNDRNERRNQNKSESLRIGKSELKNLLNKAGVDQSRADKLVKEIVSKKN